MPMLTETAIVGLKAKREEMRPPAPGRGPAAARRIAESVADGQCSRPVGEKHGKTQTMLARDDPSGYSEADDQYAASVTIKESQAPKARKLRRGKNQHFTGSFVGFFKLSASFK